MGNQCISTFLSGDLEMIHARKIMLVTDPGIVKAGLAEIVQNVLEAKHTRYCLFSDVEQEPSIETVKTCIAYAKEEKMRYLYWAGRRKCYGCLQGSSFVCRR